ncbi:MAG: arylamine N-acetyltransferase, partial [Anaerolineae bacterium]|nr:arylamine N-acetyltransferase [Anaerolineae bacterium]
PNVALLNELLTTYTQNVPWESAFRIAKRARTAQTANCPRWPDEFWHDALTLGGGGTCFESNYAFLALLQALGYSGYLTINNMSDTVGCHSAIVLTIDGEKWLADVGIPLYTALPLADDQITQRASRFHTYTVQPEGGSRFTLLRDRHIRSYIFTLIDVPVSDADYRERLTADYGDEGLFLDRVVVNKVVDGQQRRFDSAALPPRFEAFEDGQRTDYPITLDAAEAVARHFAMDEDTVRAALTALQSA